jgi:hypothetical protein
MAANDETYRFPCIDVLGGNCWLYILYRPSSQEIFKLEKREQTQTGHEIADGLEAWTRPAVSLSL